MNISIQHMPSLFGLAFIAIMFLQSGIDKLSEKDFPFSKGDEVLSIDHVPAMKVVDELSQYLGSGFSQTEKRNAAQKRRSH